jgi:hypothetical protein
MPIPVAAKVASTPFPADRKWTALSYSVKVGELSARHDWPRTTIGFTP